MSKKKTNELAVTKVAYKGFDKTMKCRYFQFEIGKTYQHDGDVEVCKSGFHSCEYPLDCFSYYEPAMNQFCIVAASGDLKTHKEDSKIASATLTITAKIEIPEIVTKSIEWIMARVDKTLSSDKNRGYSSATGDQSASSATGDRSASSATGNRSASSANGDQSASSATGYKSASSATGDRSASSATGNRSASSATGYRSASSATGNRSASSATGYQSASSATGDQSASSATGQNSVAMNIGIFGKAMAGKNGAIVLCSHDDNGNLIHIRASKVGDNGIKPDVFYTLNDADEFVEEN